MSKFTVFEGGGRKPPDLHADIVRRQLHQMIVEILRALARGDDAERRVETRLIEIMRHLSETETSPNHIVRDVIVDMNKVLDHQDWNDASSEREAIVLAALRVAAETLADDPAAKGRASRRWDDLRRAIKDHAENRVRRVRERAQQPPRTPEESSAAYQRAMDLLGGRSRVTARKRKRKKTPDDPIIL